MKPIYNDIFLSHETGMHPENKKRLEVLKLKSQEIPSGEKYLTLIHSKEYIKEVKEKCKKSLPLDMDTYTSPKSYNAAIMAVGATILASETKGFALVRPPGHHAHKNRSSGFCLFNNIAISVQKLVNEGKKVLIFDFDGHLGEGTEEIFYDTDKVLYFSTHQYPAFPNKGSVEEIGSGRGKGYTINVALPKNSGDDLFFNSIKRFLPIMKKFNPDVVAVSAGFDAYSKDLLLDLNFSLNSFYKIGKTLQNNFENIYATLEGGYNLDAIKPSIINFLDGINGNKQKYKDQNTKSSVEVKKEFEIRMKILEKNLKRYWK